MSHFMDCVTFDILYTLSRIIFHVCKLDNQLILEAEKRIVLHYNIHTYMYVCIFLAIIK